MMNQLLDWGSYEDSAVEQIVKFISSPDTWIAYIKYTCHWLLYILVTVSYTSIQGIESIMGYVFDLYNKYKGVELNDHFSTIIVCSVSVLVVLVLIRRRVKSSSVNEENEMFGLSVFDLAKMVSKNKTELMMIVSAANLESQTAYEKGHTEAVIHLVEKLHYDVNYAIPSSRLTLLLCACISGERRLVRYLLNKGGNINSRTTAGDSALYLATFGVLNTKQQQQQNHDNRLQLLHDLIKAGCSVNSQNKSGYTVLHRAASKGNIPLIKFFLQQGASPYVCSNSKVYPIDSAINSGHLEAAELLAIRLKNPHVWDIIEPHTPPRIQLGLLSPQRKHLIESTRKRKKNFNAVAPPFRTTTVTPPITRSYSHKRDMSPPVQTFKGRTRGR